MDKIIVISAPEEVKGETEIWLQLLQLGLQRLHIRKPGWSKEQLKNVTERVPVEWRTRLVIHHFPELREETGMGGVHFSYSGLTAYKGGNCQSFSVSCSVHNWHELEHIADCCDYALISPVFDSISKNGYIRNRLLQRVPEHLRHYKLYALGGVDDKNIDEVHGMGYYGAALLGHIWKNPAAAVRQLEKLMVKSTCL